MLAFPFMITHFAEAAGMKVPENCDDFDATDFPHFQVFCNWQLCRAMEWDEPDHNAKVIAVIPEEEIMTLTVEGLLAKGCRATF